MENWTSRVKINDIYTVVTEKKTSSLKPSEKLKYTKLTTKNGTKERSKLVNQTTVEARSYIDIQSKDRKNKTTPNDYPKIYYDRIKVLNKVNNEHKEHAKSFLKDLYEYWYEYLIKQIKGVINTEMKQDCIDRLFIETASKLINECLNDKDIRLLANKLSVNFLETLQVCDIQTEKIAGVIQLESKYYKPFNEFLDFANGVDTRLNEAREVWNAAHAYHWHVENNNRKRVPSSDLRHELLKQYYPQLFESIEAKGSKSVQKDAIEQFISRVQTLGTYKGYDVESIIGLNSSTIIKDVTKMFPEFRKSERKRFLSN